MRLPLFQYLAPRSTEEALEMLSRYKGKVRIIAGGTDIMNRLRQRLLSPSVRDEPEGCGGSDRG